MYLRINPSPSDNIIILGTAKFDLAQCTIFTRSGPI